MNLNNLSIEGLKVMLFMVIAVLGIAMALIGYFMSKRDAAITTATDNLIKAVEQLQVIVNGLQMQYQIRQPIVDERLKAHSELLADHGNRINTLETEHKMIHCKYPEIKQARKTKKEVKQ